MVVASQAHLFDATTWGWIHLLVGLLVAFAGWGLLGGIEGRLPTLASLVGEPNAGARGPPPSTAWMPRRSCSATAPRPDATTSSQSRVRAGRGVDCLG
jgi:hypothetical protein